MPIRTILVPIDGANTSHSTLETAYMVGRDLDAHLDVFHIAADPKDAVPLLGEGMSGAMIEEMIDLAEKDAHTRSDRAHKLFEEFRARHSVDVVDTPRATDKISTKWIMDTGREDEAVARRGRLADLIIVGQPTPASDLSSTLTLNAAIFETGRPVLLAPTNTPAALGKKIAVFWNGSAESARAASAAMPFFKQAEATVILTADSSRTSSANVSHLTDYMAWHGVSASMEAVAPAGRAVGEALLKAADQAGADMLVMGAYTHSRMRQLILGGVTKHVLANTTIPLFLIH